MRLFAENYNGVLDAVIELLKERKQYTDNPHFADALLTWQDVRGPMRELAGIFKTRLKKPIFVMQHGRGAVRDYGPPNKFELQADMILVWGETEKNRLLQYGYSAERIEVVGCPLFPMLNPRNIERQGKNVLFVPVISSKEEPENILVYGALKIWESKKLIETVYKNFDAMKKAWAWENNILKDVTLPDGTKERRLWKKDIRHVLPRWVTYGAGLLNVKLSGVHDAAQYHAPLIATNQNDPFLIDSIVDTLSNIDAMVCLEEGTMQLLAHRMNIPVIVCDIFKYENYGGCKDYDTVEKILTKACYMTRDINKVGSLVDHALACPNELKRNREQVCIEEGGANLGDANESTIKFIEQYLNSRKREPATV